jgi:paraquat-inducible protein B
VSRQGNPVLIGAFVVAALALAGAAVVFFGTGAFLKRTTTYVMFFEGDVSGLRAGAPVTFRGVPVGKVKAIRASLQRRGERVETRVAVYAELDQSVVEAQTEFGAPPAEVYRLLIENGMRAQLQMQSFVTGQLFVQLDFHPDRPAIFVGGDPSVLELPTIPTPLELVTRSARQLLERIGELPLEQIIENLNRSLAAAGELLGSDSAQRLLDDLDAAARDVGRLVKRLDGRTAGVADDLQETLDSARATLEELNGLIGELGRDSELQYELALLLREASGAARAMRVLAETLEQHPEALLSGRGAGPGGARE